MGDGKRALSKIIIGLFFKTLVSLRGLILIPIIIKSAGETVYGGYVIILSILTIIYGISSFGVDFTTWRFLPSAKLKIKKQKLFYSLLNFQLISVIFLSFIFISFYNWFDSVFLKGEIIFSKWLIIAYLFSYVLFSQGINYYRYTFRSNYYFTGNTLFSYGSILLILIYFKITAIITINAIFGSVIVMASIIAILVFVQIIKEIGIIFYFPSYNNLIARIKLGFPMIIWFLINTVLSTSDRYVILAYMKLKDVGNYSVAYSVGSLLFIFSSVIEIIIQPIISKEIDTNNKISITNIINLAIKSFFVVSIPFIVGTIFYSKPLLSILATRTVVEEASKLVPFIAIGALFYGLGMILTIILFAELKTKSILKASLFAAIFNIVANIILLYFYHNIMVAAITTAFSYIFSYLYILFMLNKSWKFNFQIALVFKLLLISYLLIRLILFLFGFLKGFISINFSFLMQISMFLFVYSLVVYLLRIFTKSDIEIIKQIHVRPI